MDFDLIVIGSGPGGYVAAIRAAQLGMKTAIVEREALGGICLNWGCIPTKALLKSGEIYEQLSHLSGYGLAVEKASFDFNKIIERSRGVAKQMSGGIAFLMKKHKIEVIEGEAKLEKGGAAPKVVVALKAGGYHLMFIDLKRQPKKGETFPATLTFEKAGPVTVDFAVEGLGEMGGMDMDANHAD